MGSLSLKDALTPSLGQAAFIAFFAYWTIWIIYTRWLHPLSKFPGPFWASVSRIWTVLHVLPGDAEKRQRKLHEKYGPIVRIAPNELITSDPAAIKTLYGTKAGTMKTDFYLAFRPPWARFPDHFSSPGGKEHGDRRRIVSSVYSMSSILQSERYIEACIDVWERKLDEMADRKESFDLWLWTRMYAYDVIGELFFSKMFGFLEAGRDHLGYIAATDDLIPVQFIAANMPTYVRSLFMLTGIMLPKVRGALKALDNLTEATVVMIKKRLAALQVDEPDAKPQRADILGKLLDISHRNGKEVDFELDDIKMESFGGFFAGSETTATTLTGILYHILRNRAVYNKLTSEIDAATQRNKLSTPHITYKEATALPYLVACIKEGMRMHPVNAVSFPRHVPETGCAVAGSWIPGGARIGVNMAVVHFDKGVFGDDAGVFRPERWIDGTRNPVEMERHLLNFGMGSRTCLGKNVSLPIPCAMDVLFGSWNRLLIAADISVRDIQGYPAATETVHV
ncbi:cytochrome P450 [Aspergillus mulundensis]|uniref:Putative Cytochrome P450 n=1 Tax=Aspergillus mulundensis TaxID=1810919 RepID=A0A3D8REP6_9EURO|nr:putative Cytochrome P450 [Aspergillus mulundensis]RDW72398.1 putative Cytochrome P450 [Aspergillus mulundensis]